MVASFLPLSSKVEEIKEILWDAESDGVTTELETVNSSSFSIWVLTVTTKNIFKNLTGIS
jgi:hypothetical protein